MLSANGIPDPETKRLDVLRSAGKPGIILCAAVYRGLFPPACAVGLAGADPGCGSRHGRVAEEQFGRRGYMATVWRHVELRVVSAADGAAGAAVAAISPTA